MPVDPNEPTYCVCDKVVVCSYYLFVCLFVWFTSIHVQVSYGQMIGCDNSNVSIGKCCFEIVVSCCCLLSIFRRMVPFWMCWTFSKQNNLSVELFCFVWNLFVCSEEVNQTLNIVAICIIVYLMSENERTNSKYVYHTNKH